jgi:hypothetical protein
MNLTKTFTALGCSLVVTAAGCQVDKSLGDWPSDQGTLLGGGGESGEGSTSSGGTAIGSGGTTADAGRDSSGGTTADAGKGGTAGTSPEAGAPNTGATAGTGSNPTGGTGGGDGGGGAPTCISPFQDPTLGFPDNAVGCPCSDEEAVCVWDRSDRPYWMKGFVCSDGYWTQVDDGPCLEPPAADGWRCTVDNQIYASGSDRSIPDPFSCNTCQCVDGELEACTEIGCEEPCPVGTVPGQRCMQCGDEEGAACSDTETGCFPPCTSDQDCDGFKCRDGVCTECTF